MDGRVVNTGTAERHSRVGFLLALSSIVGRKLEPEDTNPPLRDVRHPLGAMGRGRRYLSFTVEVNFRWAGACPEFVFRQMWIGALPEAGPLPRTRRQADQPTKTIRPSVPNRCGCASRQAGGFTFQYTHSFSP